MSKNKRDFSCDYRSILDGFMILLLFAFICFLLYVTFRFKQGTLLLFIIVSFLIMLYYILEMLNKKIILTGDKLIVCNLLGKEKVYEVYDISQITINNHRRNKYLKIKIGMKTIKVEKHARGFMTFRDGLCELLGIKGYSRGGMHTYDL